MKQVCDALAQKCLKLAREHRECAALIKALKKMGTKSTPGLKPRQSLKDTGRSRISRTPPKKEPQMRSKQQSVAPTSLGACAQKQGAEKKKQEGRRWCPGMFSQLSKTTKKPLEGQTKSVAAVLWPEGLSASTNRYVLLCHGSKGPWLEVSANVTCSAQVLSVCLRGEERIHKTRGENVLGLGTKLRLRSQRYIPTV
jgi:hypothetical protein